MAKMNILDSLLKENVKFAKKLPKNERFFDLIFIDPPYKQSCLEIIENLLEKNYKKESLRFLSKEKSI